MTTSASCSRAPDSRRSDSIGRLSERASGARDSCDSTMIGTLSSLARPLSDREIDASSSVRFSKRPRPGHQLDIVDGQHAQAVLGLEAARLGAHLERADAGGVVDEQLRLAQRFHARA